MNLNGTCRFVVGLAALGLVASCDAMVSTQGRLTRADEALHNGQFGRASIELNKVVEKEPKNGAARLLLARLALRLADTTGLEAALKRAADAGADPVGLEHLEVEALLQANKFPEAAARIESKTVLAQPDRGVLLGRALLAQSKATEALAAFDAALATDKNNGSALSGRAEALAALNKLEEATQVVDAALAADKTNWEAGFMKGRMLLAKGDRKAAEAQFRSVLGYMGRSADIRQILILRASVAEMALGDRNVKVAEEDVKQLQGIAPGAPPTDLLAARVALAKGDRRTAVALLQKVVLAVPDLVQARMLLASVQMVDGNLQQAEAELQNVLNQQPGNTQARKQLAQIRLQMGNSDGAAKALTPALAADTGDLQVFQLMDAAQMRASVGDDMLLQLRKSYEGNPKSSSLRLAYAQALYRAQKPADALRIMGTDVPAGNERLYWAIRLAAINAAQGAAAVRTEIDKLVAARPKDIALVTAAAQLLVSQRELAKAREVLLKARQADPKSGDLVLMLAQLERSLGNAPAADKLLADALGQQADSLPLRLALVDAQAQSNDFDSAIATLRAADKVNDNPDLMFVLARLELAHGNLANGQKALDRTIELAPGKAEVVGRAGALLLQAKQFDAALVQFKKASELAPDVPAYYLAIANAQMLRGDLAAARKAAERAGELDPKSAEPVVALTAIDVKDNKADAAVKRAEKFKNSNPKDAASGQLFADTLAAVKRNQDAAKAYGELQGTNPSADNALKLYQLRAANHEAGAEQPLVEWLKITPTDHRVRAALAAHYTDQSDWPKAVVEYEKLVAVFPNDAVSLNNLAWAYQAMKDKRAVPTAEKAYKSAAEAPQIGDTYGWILVQQGDVQHGLPLLQKAAEKQPNTAEIQMHYGVALGRAGQKKEGLAVLEKAATLEKDAAARAEVQKRIDELRGQL